MFTTCGSEAKRKFLLRECPGLEPDHIGNSRDTSFEEMVKTLTCGEGVDLVLNSLAGDKLQVSCLHQLASYGHIFPCARGKLAIAWATPSQSICLSCMPL